MSNIVTLYTKNAILEEICNVMFIRADDFCIAHSLKFPEKCIITTYSREKVILESVPQFSMLCSYCGDELIDASHKKRFVGLAKFLQERQKVRVLIKRIVYIPSYTGVS